MTREQAKELLPIMQAFAGGDEIQYRNNYNEWIDVKTGEGLCFTRPSSCYRIKPEPKYRPFKSQEECWQEMLQHEPFGFLSTTDKHDYFSICRVFEEEWKPKITYASNPYSDFDMANAFYRFQFADGTPFGVKEE